MLTPLIVGKWDGNHLWVQWNDSEPDTGYAIEARYSRDGEKWTRWMRTGGPAAYKKCWIKIATHQTGMLAQARVAVFSETPQFETGCRSQFLKPKVTLRISTTGKKVTFEKGQAFHACVDGAACAYRLLESIEVDAEKFGLAEAQAFQESGLNQLDYPGHFVVKPSLGVLVQNAGPSTEDIEMVGGDTVKIEIAPPTENSEFTMTLGRVNG